MKPYSWRSQEMTKMTSTEEKLCYDAVRYYQMNHVGPFKHAQYAMCDEILRKLNHTQHYGQPSVGTAD